MSQKVYFMYNLYVLYNFINHSRHILLARNKFSALDRRPAFLFQTVSMLKNQYVSQRP